MFLISILLLTPQQAALRSLVDQDLRVAAIGARLARGAADLCPGQRLSTAGLVVQDAAQYSAATRADARAALALGEGPTVVGIVERSGGDGVRVGDVVTAVNGAPIAGGPGADAYARVAQVEAAIENATGPQVVLDVVRGGAAQRVAISPVAGCRSRFQIVRGGLRATQADGRYVQISDGMIAVARSSEAAGDDALAAVLAHELAHNILRHNALKTPSKQAEYAADALSVRLVAQAGYSLDAVLPFWEALRKRTDYGIFADGTHPGWRKRIAALEAALAEVRAQQAAGQPLVPSRQEGASQPQNRR